MRRYSNIGDWPELMIRVLVRQQTSDGEDLSHLVESTDAFGPALRAIINQRDMEIDHHLTTNAFSAEKTLVVRW